MEKTKMHCKIASNIPGRLRLRTSPPKPHPEILEGVKRHLQKQLGIREIITNPVTGSILIHYDAHVHTHDNLSAILYDLGMILYDVSSNQGPPPILPHSSTATQITEVISDLDKRIYQLTSGKANLKLIMPLFMGAIGVRQVLKKGWGFSEIPGYVLIWYAIDAFHKFHQQKN